MAEALLNFEDFSHLPVGSDITTPENAVSGSAVLDSAMDFSQYEPAVDDRYIELWGGEEGDDGDESEDDPTPGYQPKTRDTQRARQLRRDGSDAGGRKYSKDPEKEFLSRVRRVLKVDDDKARELFSARPLKAVRTNRFSCDSEATATERAQLLFTELDDAEIDVTELSWFEGSFLFKASDMQDVAATDAVRKGRAFIQSPTSYMPVVALEAQAGEKIVDMCAAPGGKAALIADQIDGVPEQLVANELKPRRLERMRDVLDLLMVDTVQVVNHDAKHLGHHYGREVFERILADVECSTEAGINFESHEPLKGWSRERVTRSARLQKQILRAGYDLLKPGGTLIYSTCSLAPEENELVVTDLLDTRGGAIVQPIKLTLEERVQQIKKWGQHKIPPEASEGVLRIRPNDYLEPFTVVRIRKPTGDPELDQLMHETVDLDSLVPSVTKD